MKKFKFNLEKLLAYKNQVLDGEMQKLSIITAEIKNTEDEISRLDIAKTNTATELERKLKETISPQDCILYQNYIDKLRDTLEAEYQKLENLKIQMEKQIDIITEAKKECRSLEILKENRYSEYLKEERKAEEQEIEEFVSAAEALAKLNGG